jgi:hypothetical protein
MELDSVLDIIDRVTAWAWIRRTYLPDGVVCPVCGATITGTKALASFTNLERTYCRAHGSAFRPLAAIAPLRGTEWAPEEFVKLLLLHLAEQSASDIGALLGKSAGCVRDMLERLAVLDHKPTTGDRSLDG